MKIYTFEVVIKEGNDEWWEELNKSGKTGCEEILEDLEGTLDAVGLDVKVRLIKYEDN